MASPALPPWDRENPEQAGLLLESDYKELINQKRVKLSEDLEPDKIWAQLRELHILDKVTEERLKFNQPRPDVVLKLLEVIEKGPCWHFHGFCRALALTGQSDLIPRGGLEPDVYEEAVPFKRLPKKLVEMIRDHCRVNVKDLMRTHLFDFEGDADDDITDIAKLLVPVDVEVKGDHGKMVAIPTMDVLEQLSDQVPPQVVQLYGDTGDGKTSLLMHIAQSWSAEFLKLTDEELSSCCPHWTTIVYLSAPKIKGTVQEAIRDELGCKESDVDTMTGHVSTGDGTAVFLDSLDEVRDKKVLENIKHYVHQRKKKGGPTVFIAARTGLCPIDPLDIDRVIRLQGFTDAQGLHYVKLYTETCDVPEQPVQPDLVEYVNQYRAELKSVLTNPLRLYIFCALAVRGELDLNNERKFNIPKLFGPLERYLLHREFCKEGIEITEDQRRDFYHLCMHGLLNGLREFPESLLAKFNIAKAYYIFLRRSSRRGFDGAQMAYYSFGHEMLYEFFASRYIHSLTTEQRKSLLLSICCNEQLRNVQYIIFQILLEEWETQKDLIISMIRCILILQFSMPKNVEGKVIDLMYLCNAIEKNSFLEGMLNTKEQESKLRNQMKIWEEVNAFEKNADRLRECGWFAYVYVNGTVDHVIHCLKTCSAQQQESIYESTLCHLMPFKWSPQYMGSVFCGPQKWGELGFSPDGKHFIFVSHPWEAYKVLTEYKKKHPSEVFPMMKICFPECLSLGTTPETAWTQDEWDGLTRELIAVDSLDIIARQNTPLTGMFHSFVQNIPHLQYHYTRIQVEYGILPLNDLLSSLEKCKKLPNLSFQLTSTQLVIPSGQDETMLRAIRDKLCAMYKIVLLSERRYQHMQLLQCDPRWITESGEKYIWSDDKDGFWL